VAQTIQRHHVVERARFAQDDERPSNLRLGAGARFFERSQERVAARLAHRPAVLGERGGGHCLHRLGRIAERVDGGFDAFWIFVPGELLERLHAHLFARQALFAHRPFAPLGGLLALGQHEDVLLLGLALLDGQLGRFLLGAEREERAQAAHREDADQDRNRGRPALLEIAVVGAITTASRHTATGRSTRHVVIRRPLRKIDPRWRRVRVTSRIDFRQIRVEHGSSR
jgi:hypothetical protein